MPEKTYTESQVYIAMCLIEEIVAPCFSTTPWDVRRGQIGINALRNEVMTLIEPVDAAWSRACAAYDRSIDEWAANPTDPGSFDYEFVPGSFDYEFVPFWLRNAVDWGDGSEPPRVRGTTVTEQAA
jgi:hypothetical protein